VGNHLQGSGIRGANSVGIHRRANANVVICEDLGISALKLNVASAAKTVPFPQSTAPTVTTKDPFKTQLKTGSVQTTHPKGGVR
jgi:hypothetical protein